MSYPWYIGQKVVCVNDEPVDGKKYLKSGQTYTIQNILYAHSVIGFDLTEAFSDDYAFGASRFRPLEDNFAEQALDKALEQAKELEEIMETYKEKEIAK